MHWWVVLSMDPFWGSAEGLQATALDDDMLESMESMSIVLRKSQDNLILKNLAKSRALGNIIALPKIFLRLATGYDQHPIHNAFNMYLPLQPFIANAPIFTPLGNY